jgi:hypothetical protein
MRLIRVRQSRPRTAAFHILKHVNRSNQQSALHALTVLLFGIPYKFAVADLSYDLASGLLRQELWIPFPTDYFHQRVS